jgi:hypothetical protein
MVFRAPDTILCQEGVKTYGYSAYLLALPPTPWHIQGVRTDRRSDRLPSLTLEVSMLPLLASLSLAFVGSFLIGSAVLVAR